MKTIFTLLIVLASVNMFAQNKTSIVNASAKDFKKFVDDKKGMIIDLRTNDEIKKEGIIPGAVQIDFLAKDAEEKINKLDHNKTVLIYCAGGGRSADCAALMEKQGFLQVVNLEKGFSDWKKQGFPIAK